MLSTILIFAPDAPSAADTSRTRIQLTQQRRQTLIWTLVFASLGRTAVVCRCASENCMKKVADLRDLSHGYPEPKGFRLYRPTGREV